MTATSTSIEFLLDSSRVTLACLCDPVFHKLDTIGRTARTIIGVEYTRFKFWLSIFKWIQFSGTPLKLATYLFRKGSPIIKRFNSAVFSTQKLTDRIWSVYYGDQAVEKRANHCKKSKTLRPLSTEACFGLFALFVVGFSLALSMLLVENCEAKANFAQIIKCSLFWSHRMLRYMTHWLNRFSESDKKRKSI